MIYINGVLQVQSSGSGLNMATPLNDGIAFGRYATGGVSSEFYQGGLAIMRVYNSALTVTDILQNFNFNRSRFGI